MKLNKVLSFYPQQYYVVLKSCKLLKGIAYPSFKDQTINQQNLIPYPLSSIFSPPFLTNPINLNQGLSYTKCSYLSSFLMTSNGSLIFNILVSRMPKHKSDTTTHFMSTAEDCDSSVYICFRVGQLKSFLQLPYQSYCSFPGKFLFCFLIF